MNSIKKDINSIRVLLTGASGYLAGHVLNLLLERGYKVRGTVRSLQNPKKVDHIYQINPSKRANLELVEADLTQKESWDSVMKDIDYVIHTASPLPQYVPKDENELILPAVNGTEAIFQAALKNRVKKIVMTSSVAAVSTGITSKNFFTAEDWSVPENSAPYEKSKHLAEKKAWEIYEQNKQNLHMTVILPGYMQGPSFHSNDYVSADFVLKVMKNELPGVPKVSLQTVDVRDVALAHVIPIQEDMLELTNGKRYILNEGTYWMIDLVEVLREEFAQFKYKLPSMTVESKFLFSIASLFDKQAALVKPSFQRRIMYDNTPAIQELGIKFKHHRHTLVEFAYDLIKKGCIPNKLNLKKAQKS